MLNERYQAIMNILTETRKASVHELATRLFVSEATVRRDLIEMKTMGLIERSRGHALLPDRAEEVSLFVRMNENAHEKEKAAAAALGCLPDFHSVFIDSSSTALALAQRMDLQFKTVVTNGLQTALLLSKKKDVNLILLGGGVQYNTASATGSWTVRQMGDFSFDLMLSSCAAIAGDEVLERTMEQREIKLASFLRSRTRVLIADHFKFGSDGTYRLASLGDYDMVATDRKPPDALLEKNISFVYHQE